MKYSESIYRSFEQFFAQAIEIAKDKVGLFNSLVSPPVRKKIESSSFQEFLSFIIYIIKKTSWYIYVFIGGLLALGAIGFYGGIGTLMAANPILAAAIVAVGGGSVYLIWKHKDFVILSKKIGERYKNDYDGIISKYQDIYLRENDINQLMRRCVKSLCIECFQANNDAFIQKLENEDF